MTAIADVLQEFFSPWSQEKVWVMDERDKYTMIVRDWAVVRDAVSKVKEDLTLTLSEVDVTSKWPKNTDWCMTDPMWRPNMAASKMTERFGRPGHRHRVNNPPGTLPADCKKALYIYLGSLAATELSSPLPRPLKPEPIQTETLFRGAIGSFTLYSTIDKLDNQAGRAQLSFWIFNAMTPRSFSPYDREPLVIKLRCGMKAQYMWWNWSESVDWNSGWLRTTLGWR